MCARADKHVDVLMVNALYQRQIALPDNKKDVPQAFVLSKWNTLDHFTFKTIDN